METQWIIVRPNIAKSGIIKGALNIKSRTKCAMQADYKAVTGTLLEKL